MGGGGSEGAKFEIRTASVSLTENTEPSVVRLALEPRQRNQAAKGGSLETGCKNLPKLLKD